jgi:septum site-determining protein MinC
MSSKSSESASSHVFEIKSGAVHLPVLKLLGNDMDALAAQLKDKIRQAPDFFRHAPMAVDLHEMADADIDFPVLMEAMRGCGLVPVGVCGASERHIAPAREVELPLLTLVRHEAAPRSSEARPTAEASAPATPAAEEKTSKIVDIPVRSGQRIYAAGCDLVVLAPVSAGAEIMADGNIHVYGALRGRALAGVQGNLASRIFCHDLQAELIAVGGHYKISENIEDAVRGKPVQIYLKDNALIIEKLDART